MRQAFQVAEFTPAAALQRQLRGLGRTTFDGLLAWATDDTMTPEELHDLEQHEGGQNVTTLLDLLRTRGSFWNRMREVMSMHADQVPTL